MEHNIVIAFRIIMEIDIRIPLYRDEHTPEFTSEGPTKGIEEEGTGNGSISPLSNPPPNIHMDATVFGMGCCCLQVTFQVKLLGFPMSEAFRLSYSPDSCGILVDVYKGEVG